MKKTLLIAIATLSLAACTTATTETTTVGNGITTATNVGVGVFKYAVDQKCRVEIQNHAAWKVASVAMTSAQQATALNNVCGCVSEKAPQNLTVVELGQVAVDQNARNQLVTKAVANTLNACYSEVMKSSN